MTQLLELSQELERLVANTAPSVVAVEHDRGQGSGVIIADDGYVVTNAHVVRDERKLRVRLGSGAEYPAELVGSDPATDLAVVRVAARSLPSLSLYETRRLRVGQLVVAIGNPLRFDQSVTLGIVSALDRSLPGPRGSAYEGLVQTDAAINPGNSGGPLLDASGAVAGINTAIIPFARGIGFAVPAYTASWVAALLMKEGHIERPALGVAARGVDLPPREALEHGQPRAVRLFEVAANSPADAAGLRAGDLLLSAGGLPLASVDDLCRAMVFSKGEALELRVLRDGAVSVRSARPAVRPRPRAA
jgi:serine protease Do